jgi:L-iditol 2-dehydrogenase
MGHEYTGIVRDVGVRGNKKLIGQAVACEPSFGCGECAECRDKRISQCARATRVGGFAERVVLPVENVHLLPEGLSPLTAALTEPAACCLSNLEMFEMPRDATVLVMGGGIIGLLTLALALRRGAKRAILSDPLADRRDVARRLGAEVVVDPTREDLRETVLGLTGGRGVDVACEAVGKPALVREALTLTRPRGVLQIVGVNPKGSEMALDLYDVHWREIRIHGAYGRGTSFRRALKILPSLGVDSLVTGAFPLEQVSRAFAHASAGNGVKTVLAPQAVA